MRFELIYLWWGVATVGKMKRARSFSLAELLVVLAILGAVAFLAMPTYRTLFSSLKLEGNARRIASALRLYHQRAITDHVNHALAFYSAGDYYKINDQEPPDYWKIDEGVKIGNDVTITFYPLGNADVSPAGQTIVLERDGDTYTIEVKSTTGHVRIRTP